MHRLRCDGSRRAGGRLSGARVVRSREEGRPKPECERERTARKRREAFFRSHSPRSRLMEEPLKRGDLVEYEGKLYYFQPNGNSCFLYERLEDVGNKEKKVRSPAKKSVRRAASPFSPSSSHPAARRRLPLTSDLDASDCEMQAAPVTGGGSELSEVSSLTCTQVSTLLSDSSTHESATDVGSAFEDEDSAKALTEALGKAGIREVRVASGFDPASLPRDSRFKHIRELIAICNSNGGGLGTEASVRDFVYSRFVLTPLGSAPLGPCFGLGGARRPVPAISSCPAAA